MSSDVLVAKDAIREALYRYCRVLDRMDKPGAYALWNAGSEVLYHGIYEGSGPGFVDWVWEAHAVMERHSHQISNVMIEVAGDRAVSEAYVTVALWQATDSPDRVREIIARGRYFDRWSKQPDAQGQLRWGIDRREHVVDLHTSMDVERCEVAAASRRDAQDPLYATLDSLPR